MKIKTKKKALEVCAMDLEAREILGVVFHRQILGDLYDELVERFAHKAREIASLAKVNLDAQSMMSVGLVEEEWRLAQVRLALQGGGEK